MECCLKSVLAVNLNQASVNVAFMRKYMYKSEICFTKVNESPLYRLESCTAVSINIWIVEDVFVLQHSGF